MVGRYYHSIDTKGRINFPVKLREILGEQFVITQGLDGCLFVYTNEDWDEMASKLDALPIGKGRGIQRFFFTNAAHVEQDKQGRVVIPAPLREHANLDKEVVIVGVSKRTEIWDREKWEALEADISEQDVMEMMDELGI